MTWQGPGSVQWHGRHVLKRFIYRFGPYMDRNDIYALELNIWRSIWTTPSSFYSSSPSVEDVHPNTDYSPTVHPYNDRYRTLYVTANSSSHCTLKVTYVNLYSRFCTDLEVVITNDGSTGVHDPLVATHSFCQLTAQGSALGIWQQIVVDSSTCGFSASRH
jgi:hypothetical protein